MSLRFPRDFRFGFSSSDFQSEMGRSDPVTDSDWYAWVHDSENMASGLVSGDFPEDGPAYWDLYAEDHTLAQSLGLDSGRLGLHWPRIFPKSTECIEVDVFTDGDDVVSVDLDETTLEKLDGLSDKAAVRHYWKIFEDFKSLGNQLILNLYHWPIPLWLHDPLDVRRNGLRAGRKGWVDSRCVVEFAKYAAFVSWKFGDIADLWSTMNEPNVVCDLGYMAVKAGFPPAFISSDCQLAARKHLIEAHCRAYDAIRKNTKKPVGLIYANSDYCPLRESDADAVAMAEKATRYCFFDSIVKGDMKWYSPNAEKSSVAEKSAPSRKDMKGRLDWIGVNYYTRQVVTIDGHGWKVVPGYGHACSSQQRVSLGGRSVSDFGWEVYPEGLCNEIMGYHGRYHMPMIVTENGISDKGDRLRSRYIVSHLAQVHKALAEGARVEGYLHWALTDNFEWAAGYGQRFGLIRVDMKTKQRQLTPSSLVYREIATAKEIPDSIEWMADPVF